ncbi:hypothetical protein ABT071_21800 [Streptomyces sp. NPDC002506]|uniref:hypothetical protein n=1 Tax=Streptomyces sp. NPDC002506 TaxID=3154536 RepID=UPI00332414E4
MAQQGITATAEIPRDADGSIGGEVLFTPADLSALRVVLAEPADSPAADAPAQPVLGPGMSYDPNTMLQQGYVNRIQFVPDGTRRQIQIGTQRHGSTTDWFNLDDVKLTPAGLSTPAVEEIQKLRTTRGLIGARTPKTAPPAKPGPPSTTRTTSRPATARP